jgi:hypothetical protein
VSGGGASAARICAKRANKRVPNMKTGVGGGSLQSLWCAAETSLAAHLAETNLGRLVELMNTCALTHQTLFQTTTSCTN